MEVLGFFSGLLPLLLIIGLVVWGVRRVSRRGAPQPGEGHGIRRFFQYLLLFGLLWVSGVGLAGLLGRLFDLGSTVAEDPGLLALYTAFTVVGVPLFAMVAAWTVRRFRADPREARSPAWNLYLTAASLGTLVAAMVALHETLSWATGVRGGSASTMAGLLVWGLLWFAHWWVSRRLLPADAFAPHRFLAAIVGLVVAAVGATGLLGDVFATFFGFTRDSFFAGGDELFLPGAITLAVGLTAWLVYWVVPSTRYRRSPLWLAYVLLAGVAAGLVTAVASASLLLYDVLVWVVGEPASGSAASHFDSAPASLGAALVGALIWWYHRAVLQAEQAPESVSERTEVRRIYEYAMSGVGLVAAAAGLMMLVVAVFEAAAGSGDILSGAPSALNTMLGGLTLILVGGPVWWLFWRRIQAAVAAHPDEEHGSPTRRIYVFLLFGVAGVAAVVALLLGVYVLLQDLFGQGVTAETVRGLRFPVAVIVAAGLLSAYHWGVYRGDRDHVQARERGARFVLLVGPPDPEIAQALARRTGGRVELWARTDGVAGPWALEELVAVVAGRGEGEVVVVAGEHGVTAVPVDRG